MAKSFQMWADAKDRSEAKLGIKPYCPQCRVDSHTEAQSTAGVVRQAFKRKNAGPGQ